MDNLIFDAVSIFTQILQQFAPDYVGDYGFLLSGYIAGCVFVLLTLWMLYRLLSAFGHTVLSWMSRGW